MKRNCILRDLDSTHTTAPMSCIKAVKLAKSGNCAINWSLDEVVFSTEGSAPILRPRINFSKGKYNFLINDIDL